ncbi:unnamed protein product [Amoebophrya sp. A25]|nr:unnamed protein product [Amoebophrya sp. A25]|eukprot:GSA25T00022094001.1
MLPSYTFPSSLIAIAGSDELDQLEARVLAIREETEAHIQELERLAKARWWASAMECGLIIAGSLAAVGAFSIAGNVIPVLFTAEKMSLGTLAFLGAKAKLLASMLLGAETTHGGLGSSASLQNMWHQPGGQEATKSLKELLEMLHDQLAHVPPTESSSPVMVMSGVSSLVPPPPCAPLLALEDIKREWEDENNKEGQDSSSRLVFEDANNTPVDEKDLQFIVATNREEVTRLNNMLLMNNGHAKESTSSSSAATSQEIQKFRRRVTVKLQKGNKPAPIQKSSLLQRGQRAFSLENGMNKEVKKKILKQDK